MELYLFVLQAYREDEKICQKLYSNPDMFFEIWKEDFINKMEEERKKRRQEAKERKKERLKTQSENRREVKNKKKLCHCG